MADTIYALSSGAPPAAIGIIRVSGSEAGEALRRLAGSIPVERRPSLRTLRNADGEALDESLVLWFPGPNTSTGEDLVEFHCHGGRAVVGAIKDALKKIEGFREAEPGEFTRRAFSNGQIDLAQAEGLADLLSAETELQRRQALLSVRGTLSNRIEGWRSEVLRLGAYLEATLDFEDEEDVPDLGPTFTNGLNVLIDEMGVVLTRPSADRMKDGVRVVFAGPPNAGKSSLFNCLLEEGVAIVSDEAGTTRDVLERPVALNGVPFTLVDTAGIHEKNVGIVEAAGIEKAMTQVGVADIVIWMGPADQAPRNSITVQSKADLEKASGRATDFLVSAETGFGVQSLITEICRRAEEALPKANELSFRENQKRDVEHAMVALVRAGKVNDLLAAGEELRIARVSMDRLLGRDSTEAMLDTLFARFCIGT